MQRTLPLSIALLAAAIAVHAMLPAQAAPAPVPAPPPVVEPAPPPPPKVAPNCQKFQGKLSSPVSLSEVQSWMTQQQDSGRTQFVSVVTDLTYAVVCAY